MTAGELIWEVILPIIGMFIGLIAVLAVFAALIGLFFRIVLLVAGVS